MVEFDIKRGHYKNLDGEQLQDLLQETFGNVSREGDALVSRFGALDPITVRVVDKSTLAVDIATGSGVSDEVALDSIRAKNAFLEAATGFTSSQRSKRVQKKAKDGKL